MRRSTLLALGLVAGTTLSAGCSRNVTTPSEPLDTSQAALRRIQSCGELEAALRDDARAKMHLFVDAQIRALRDGYRGYGYGYGGVVIDAGAPMAAGGAAPGQAPSRGATTGGSGGAGGSSKSGADNSTATGHSETNAQVKGVDEADFVKADNKFIYLLHGQKLLVLTAWPSESLAEASSVDVEGQPSEMYVENGKVVVYSTVDGTAVYTAANLKARSPYQEASGGYGGYAGGGLPMGNRGAAASAPYPGRGGAIAQNPLTKVTVFTLEGAKASVAREMYFEGSYLSSRRVGSKVRTVLAGGVYGPALKYNVEVSTNSKYAGSNGPTGGVAAAPTTEDVVAAWEKVRADNDALLDKTTYADWLPYAMVKEGGVTRASTTQCGDFYVPRAGTTEVGLTQIETFDLDAPSAPPRAAAILGAVDTVYSSESTMVLASRAYTDPWVYQQINMASGSWPTQNGAIARPPIELSPITLNWTHLHAFDLTKDPLAPVYSGSGKVPGNVKDQFSIDERKGIVRITTTEQRYVQHSNGRDGTVSHLYTLENRRGRLEVKGDVGEIAPGETLYSVRFVGDKSYVCTYRVKDPLFVIDVGDAAKPKILGELHIPGFSEYMHPLGDNHLLTIGRETKEDGTQHDAQGRWYGLALQLFDVSVPTQPKLAQKVVFGQGAYPTSEAESNHKAFTYFADRKLLAFPFTGSPDINGTMKSTLELYKVDVATGIEPIGTLDNSKLFTKQSYGGYGYYGGYFGPSVRRGLFLDNVAYSISYGGVIAAKVDDLANPVKTLALPSPVMEGYPCGK